MAGMNKHTHHFTIHFSHFCDEPAEFEGMQCDCGATLSPEEVEHIVNASQTSTPDTIMGHPVKLVDFDESSEGKLTLGD